MKTVNPFVKDNINIRSIAFNLDSILHKLDLLPDYKKRDAPYQIKGVDVLECNFNPYVYINGEKKYYQRPLVWSLNDKQNLIESIYNGVNCGLILIKLNNWDTIEQKINEGETEIAFNDVVDGKQRLNAIVEFVNNQFPDHQGNYYKDFDMHAKHLFLDHQLFSYGEISNTNDEDILKQFLKVNFTGVPQSTEHLQYLKTLL